MRLTVWRTVAVTGVIAVILGGGITAGVVRARADGGSPAVPGAKAPAQNQTIQTEPTAMPPAETDEPGNGGREQMDGMRDHMDAIHGEGSFDSMIEHMDAAHGEGTSDSMAGHMGAMMGEGMDEMMDGAMDGGLGDMMDGAIGGGSDGMMGGWPGGGMMGR